MVDLSKMSSGADLTLTRIRGVEEKHRTRLEGCGRPDQAREVCGRPTWDQFRGRGRPGDGAHRSGGRHAPAGGLIAAIEYTS
jgi:hypothetical protein